MQVFRIVLLLLCPVSLLHAQQVDDGRMQIDRQQAEKLITLLSDPVVAKELSFDPSDLSKIRRTQREKSRVALDRLRQLAFMPPGSKETISEKNELMESLDKEFRELIMELLTPIQFSRLSQISARTEVAKFGYTYALTRGDLSKATDITEKQRAELGPQISQLESHANKEIAKIKKKLEQDVIHLLTPEQRSKAREAVGERFDHVPLSPFDNLQRMLNEVGSGN